MRLTHSSGVDAPLPLSSPHHLILGLTPTPHALNSIRFLQDEGHTPHEIWGVISLRLARLIERHYAISAFAEPMVGVSMMFPRVDSFLEEILPRVNLLDMIQIAVGHSEVTVDIKASCWRVGLRLDYFPW